MPAGRPTLYKEEYCEEVESYIGDCNDVWDEFHKTRGLKSDSYERIIKVNLPTHEGFAKRIGVTVKTLYNWADEHDEFLQALDKILVEQKDRLIKEGLAGNYNPTIAKLVLSSNHGMVEKMEKDITTKGNPIVVVSQIPDEE